MWRPVSGQGSESGGAEGHSRRPQQVRSLLYILMMMIMMMMMMMKMMMMKRVILDIHNKCGACCIFTNLDLTPCVIIRLRAQLARGEERRGRPGPQPPAANMREMVSSRLID